MRWGHWNRHPHAHSHFIHREAPLPRYAHLPPTTAILNMFERTSRVSLFCLELLAGNLAVALQPPRSVMRELIARPREISAGLPDVAPLAGSVHSVSLGSDAEDGPEGRVLSVSGSVGTSSGSGMESVGFGAVNFAQVEPRTERSSANLSSTGTNNNMEEGEGRVFIARPRVISEPDEPRERVLPVRPREINAPAASSPAHTADVPAGSIHSLGPRGLVLPVWKSEYASEKAKAEEQIKMRAVESGHVHGYGGGKAYWDAYYADPSCCAEAYTREWYCNAETLRPHLVAAAPGMVALEVGCGTSMVSSLLEDLGYAVLASDFSKAALADVARGDAGGEQLLADCCR